MSRLIAILALALAFTGCITKKRCIEQYARPVEVVERVRDSIHVEVEYRDTTITVPGDTVRIEIDCDSLEVAKPVKKQGERGTVTITKTPEGTLEIECECTEEQITIKALNRTIKELRVRESERKEVREVKHIPWYARWYTVLIAIAAAWIAGRLRIPRLF